MGVVSSLIQMSMRRQLRFHIELNYNIVPLFTDLFQILSFSAVDLVSGMLGWLFHTETKSKLMMTELKTFGRRFACYNRIENLLLIGVTLPDNLCVLPLNS